jgi:hypothetical protein
LGSYGNLGEPGEPLGTYGNPRGTLGNHGSENVEYLPTPLAVIRSVTCMDLRLYPQNGVRCIGIACLNPHLKTPKESQEFATLRYASLAFVKSPQVLL